MEQAHVGCDRENNDNFSSTQNSQDDNHVDITSLGRSNRPQRPLVYLADFECENHISKDQVKYPIWNVMSYNSLYFNYQNYLIQVSSISEPIYYHQAIQSSEWRKAMQDELKALEDNST